MLDFAQNATAEFSFLLDYHGFSVSASAERDITFTSEKTYVKLHWERFDGELTETIGLRSLDPQHRYGSPIQFVCEILGTGKGSPPALYARNEKTLLHCLNRFADLTRECAMPPLLGDKESFLQLMYARSLYTRGYTKREDSDRLARERLQRSWDDKDYIGFLSKIGYLDQDQLTEEEVRHWEVARKAFLEDDRY